MPLKSPPDLSDKTYLITGGANGIGLSLSKMLCELNANVILLDKDEAGLEKAYDEIIKNNLGTPIIIHQDLTLLTDQHCETIANQIQTNFNVLNGVFHCAVETGNLSPLDFYTDDDWSKVIRANLHAPYLLTRKLLPLIDSGNDTSPIVFSVSDQAEKASAFWGAFAVACQGLKALIQCWSQETEDKNLVMLLIDPGKVNSSFLTRLYPGLNPNRYPAPDTIAKLYLQLLFPDKALYHGKLLSIVDEAIKITE